MAEQVSHCGVLFIDIAGSTALRAHAGDDEAGRCLRQLLDGLTALVRAHHGRVLKSDGDDLLCLFQRPRQCAADAAETAIVAQRAARNAGLGLYAGLHAGPVKLQEVLGRTDVDGLAVNFAARLHKLIPGVPGNIFLAEEIVAMLPADIAAGARLFGERQLKGIGEIRVYTLDWKHNLTAAPTQMAGRLDARNDALLLKTHADSLRLLPSDPPLLIGRSKSQCGIAIDDPDLLVSSRHLKLLHQHGGWYAQDISRNGTWLLNGATGESLHLLNIETMLPRSGALYCGRPPTMDQSGRFRLDFELFEA